jgi:uncharacterized membrane protein YdbT with pleckstrin-like domain
MRAMGYPEDVLGSGESILLHTRTHWKAVVGAIVWALLGVVGIVVVLAFIPADGATGTVRWIALLAIVVALLVLSVWPTMTWLSGSYTITSQRIMERKGLLRQTGRNIPLQRVSGVSFEKDLLDRMVGCGTLKIESSAEFSSVVFRDVPDVEQVQRLVTDLIADQRGGE